MHIDPVGQIEELVGHMESMLDGVESGGLRCAIGTFKKTKNIRERIYKCQTRLTKMQEKLAQDVIPEMMKKQDIKNVTYDDLGVRAQLSSLARASIIKEKQEEAFDWLREKGYSEIIKPTVNASTLSSIYGRILKGEEEIMDMPEELFNTHVRTACSLVKV